MTGVGIKPGTTVASINAGASVVLSQNIETAITSGDAIAFGADRVFKITGMSEDLLSSGYQADLFDKDHISGTHDSAIVTGQVTMASKQNSSL